MVKMMPPSKPKRPGDRGSTDKLGGTGKSSKNLDKSPRSKSSKNLDAAVKGEAGESGSPASPGQESVGDADNGTGTRGEEKKEAKKEEEEEGTVKAVTEIEKVRNALTQKREQLERAIQQSKGDLAVRLAQSLVSSAKAHRQQLSGDDESMAYLTELEVYMQELQPRVESAMLHSVVRPYLLAGSKLVQRLADAEDLFQNDVIDHCRTQLEKIAGALVGRFDKVPVVQEFLALCRRLEPPLKIEAMSIESNIEGGAYNNRHMISLQNPDDPDNMLDYFFGDDAPARILQLKDEQHDLGLSANYLYKLREMVKAELEALQTGDEGAQKHPKSLLYLEVLEKLNGLIKGDFLGPWLDVAVADKIAADKKAAEEAARAKAEKEGQEGEVGVINDKSVLQYLKKNPWFLQRYKEELEAEDEYETESDEMRYSSDEDGVPKRDPNAPRKRRKKKKLLRQSSSFISSAERDKLQKEIIMKLAKMDYAELELNSLMSDIVEGARTLLNSDRCALFIVDDDNQELYTTIEGNKELRIPKKAGIAGHVAVTGTTLNIPDAYQDSRFNQEVDKATGYKTDTILCMPIKSRAGKVVAVGQLINKRGGPYTSEDERTFAEFAVYCGIAIGNAQFYEKVVKSEQFSKMALGEAKKLYRNNKLLLRLAKAVDSVLDTKELVEKITKLGCELVNADRCTVFLIDHDAKQLIFEVNGNEIRIPMEGGIAGYVATTGKRLNIKDAYKDPRFNREVDTKTGYRTKTILCMPICNQEGQIVGVAQLINKNGGVFTKEDEKMFDEFAVYCGIGLANARLFESTRRAEINAQKQLLETKRLSEQNDTLLALAKTVGNELDLSSLIPKISELGKQLIKADRCTIFLLDAEAGELYSRWIQGVKEVRFSIENGLAGACAKDGQPLNIKNAYRDSRFNRDVDTKTGYMTSSVLCMPIRNDQKSVIGVAQLVNKLTGTGKFNQDDELSFEAFAVFCGLALNNAQLYRRATVARQQAQVALELISYHHTATIDDVKILESQPRPGKERLHTLQAFEFPVHELQWDDQVRLLVEIYVDLGLTTIFNISLSKLKRFLLTVRKNYPKESYHDWAHAFTVTHTMYVYLTKTKARAWFSPIEVLSLLTACIMHDIDHRGIDNEFCSLDDVPLARVYNATATAHSYHWDRCVTILSSEAMNIFCNMDTADYDLVWRVLKKHIYGFDLNSLEIRMSKLSDIVDTKFDESDTEQRGLLGSLLLVAADLSTMCKVFIQSHHYAELVSAEFFSQAPSMLQGKRPSDLPALQLNMIEKITLPLYMQLTRLIPELKGQLKPLTKNKQTWEAQVRK